ncbi:MAG: hypothetical protein HUJ29_05540 [Gammaproteobacteria bacterium]|nr:hypothetical protein [Gammaproteobacteria bacterium]
MRTRKPDIMWVLALVIGLGVLATGFAQDYLRDKQPNQAESVRIANS